MARAKPLETTLVTWRDGVHLRGTVIWCDARRSRAVCFVSCAHALGHARHGQLIATAPTLDLLSAQAAQGAQVSETQLSVPYGRPFTLGTVRLELLRSGHGLGSASLVADATGHRVLYASAVNTHGGGLGGAADVRQCDALVVAAAYGHPMFAFPPVNDVVHEVAAFVQEVTAAQGAAVLLLTSPSKALDVASRLADLLSSKLPAGAAPSFFAHRLYHDAARRLVSSHPSLPRMRRYAGKLPAGHVLLWPAQRRDALPPALPRPSRVALVSGGAMDRELVATLAVDTAFPWSNQADCDELVEYIRTSGARQIFLTHRFAETLAERLAGKGRVIRALGPPRQMSLFDEPFLR